MIKIEKILLEKVLSKALESGADFSEIFIEDRWDNSLLLVGGKLENSLSGKDFGVGLRVIKDLFEVYSYTNDISEESLMVLAKEASDGIKGKILEKQERVSNIKKEITLKKKDVVIINPIEKLPNSIKKSQKIEVMKMANEYAKNYSALISQVKVSYNDYTQNILIANSEGLLVEDTRVRIRLNIQSIASKNDIIQSAHVAPGAYKGYEFIENLDIKSLAEEASRIAITTLNAELCPSGQMPVIIENGFGGVIFHEACGHGLESSSVSKGASVFTGKVGQQIASTKVTAIDDGTMGNEWGSVNIDDEGNPPQRKILIENGILKSYMIDKLGGKRMGLESTGSGRRQNYSYAPTSRMTNTFIAAGTDKLEDMLKGVKKGLYAKYMGGGSVNPATGDFNFSVMEGYLIEDGKITTPVKGATLIGNGPKILMEIDMVGDNFLQAQGMCGSSSGSIPTNVGQARIRIKNILVGGRK